MFLLNSRIPRAAPVPVARSQSFSRGYESSLPNSLTRVVLWPEVACLGALMRMSVRAGRCRHGRFTRARCAGRQCLDDARARRRTTRSAHARCPGARMPPPRMARTRPPAALPLRSQTRQCQAAALSLLRPGSPAAKHSSAEPCSTSALESLTRVSYSIQDRRPRPLHDASPHRFCAAAALSY